MKCCLTVNYRWTLTSLAVCLFVFTLPVHAETNYLFPSDIIDQSEQVQYEVGRADRYATQRKWAYPDVSRSSGQKPNYSRQYMTVDGQPVFEENARPRHHPGDVGLKWFEDSAHYKYDNFKPGQTNKQYQQPYSADKQFYNSAQTYSETALPQNSRYPEQNRLKPYDRRNRRQVRQEMPMTNAENSYKPTFAHGWNRYPNLLYPSDMEVKRGSGNRKTYSINSFSFNGYSDRSPMRRTQNMQIQYVPVPVYGVPGTLPGTVPGVITPRNMVPGYSHLSPGYNYLSPGYNYAVPGTTLLNRRSLQHNGFGNLMATPYNPMTGLSGFPGVTNPFDSFYKSDDNNSQHSRPFASPETMPSEFSMPDMFSTH